MHREPARAFFIPARVELARVNEPGLRVNQSAASELGFFWMSSIL